MVLLRRTSTTCSGVYNMNMNSDSTSVISIALVELDEQDEQDEQDELDE